MRFLTIILSLTILSLAGVSEGLEVSIPHLTAIPDGNVTVPIGTTDVTGLYAVQIVITYDQNVVRPTEISTLGTILQGVAVVVNMATLGQIRIAASSASPFGGAGTLLFLKFDVVGAVGDTTELTLESVVFNEGSPGASITNGSLRIVGAGPPILLALSPDSAIVVSGNTIRFTATGRDGMGHTVPIDPVWDVTGGIGTINSTGLFTAGAPGTGYVIAQDGVAIDSASVTVLNHFLLISPDSIAVNVGAAAQFKAVARSAQGDTIEVSPDWTLIGEIGIITTGGLLMTAKAGFGIVIAAYESLVDSAFVSVVRPPIPFEEENVWISIGPDHSGHVSCLTINTDNPSAIYAGTRGGGVFKSTDGGDNWTRSSYGLTSPFIRSLALDPQNPSVVYAGTDNGIFKCVDGGSNWGEISEGLTNADVLSLALDPQNPSILYAGTNSGGVFKSESGGLSWAQINGGLTNMLVRSVVIDPDDTSVIYAGTDGGGVFKTSDGGTSWTKVNVGLTNTFIYSLAIDSQNPSILYAGTGYSGGIFKTENGGVTWTQVSGGTSTGWVYALVTDPLNSGVVYAGDDREGVFKSTDGGYTWDQINSGLTSANILSFAIDPQNPSTVYVGTFAGIFKSDAVLDWTPINNGLSAARVRSIIMDPENPSVMYVGAYGGGIFKSVDGGASWVSTNNGLGNLVQCLTIDPQNPFVLYTGLFYGGVSKSDDGALSWDQTGTVSSSNVMCLAIDPQSPSIVYAGTSGETWLSGGSIFRSINGADSWSVLGRGPTNTQIQSLAIDPQNSSIVYAGTREGIFMSLDRGLSWTLVNNGLTSFSIRSLAVDPQNSSEVYAGTYGGGVFQSNDKGSSWTQINNGLTDTRILCVAIDPQNPSVLYAGTDGGGVFKGEHKGARWSQINTELTNLHVAALAVNPEDPSIVYAGTRGAGVFVMIQTPVPLVGDVSGNGIITAFDASLILQKTVGLITLPDAEFPNFVVAVADVTGNGTISALDASHILQFSVGLITVFSIEGEPASKVAFGERCIRLGDIMYRDRLVVPILIDDITGVLSGEMALSFDPSKLRPIEASVSDLTSDYLFASNIQNATIKLSFAGAESKTGGGRIAEIVFEPLEEVVGVLSAVSLVHAQLNEGMIAVRVGAREVPEAYALMQNYPNPFNPETAVEYTLPEETHVRLVIYNTTGQTIRTLVEASQSAGYHQVVWDSRNDQSQPVGGGVYFYRMTAGGFSETKRMILLR